MNWGKADEYFFILLLVCFLTAVTMAVIGGNITRNEVKAYEVACTNQCTPYVGRPMESPSLESRSCMCWDGKGWQVKTEEKEK